MTRDTIDHVLEADGELPLAGDLRHATTGWFDHLEHERGRSPATLASYERDLRQFLAFLKHDLGHPPCLADLARLDVKAVRLTLWQAAFRIAAGLPDTGELRTAAFWAADAGHRVAHTTVHVHGGVGLDEDHPVHRYFLAAKHHEFLLGSATTQLRSLGAELASTPA